jgi:streptogramin lyase
MGGVTRAYQQGGYGPEGVLATESQFQNPRGLNFAPNGDVYITDALNHRVRRIDQGGVVHLVAGTGIPGSSGDGGDAKFAQLNEPHGVAVDTEGNVYIADSRNCVIRKVDTAGIITRYAGTGAKNPSNPGACAKTDGNPGWPRPHHRP